MNSSDLICAIGKVVERLVDVPEAETAVFELCVLAGNLTKEGDPQSTLSREERLQIACAEALLRSQVAGS